MKIRRFRAPSRVALFRVAAACVAVLSIPSVPCAGAEGSYDPYLGDWELVLTGTGDTFRSGALVLEKHGDGVSGELVWRWGSVARISPREVTVSEDGELAVSPRGWKAPLLLHRIGGMLEGSHDEGDGKTFAVLGTPRRDIVEARGTWDLRASTPEHVVRGVLEVRSEGAGRLNARGYHDDGREARVENLTLDGNVLSARVWTPAEGDGSSSEPRELEGEIRGDRFVGVLRAGGDGRDAVKVEGERRRRFGPPVRILDDGLAGFRPRDARGKFGWTVEDGVLTNDPPGDVDIVTNREFDDFRLHLEYKVASGGNSGVYLRGRYEVQILDDYRPGEPRTDPHGNGAVYSRIPQSRNVSRPAGEWQTYDITLVDRYLTVVLNGERIIDNQRVDGITGGALDPWEALPGPLMLQGDHGKVWYRNVIVTPALDPALPATEKEAPRVGAFAPLFPNDGEPSGWVVRAWSDVSEPGPEGARWNVVAGVLHGSDPRGTWLVSEREYGDFILDFDWRIGERGNGGCGLRFPPRGDPAFDGLELQMVDPRYYPPEQTVGPAELTGALYKAVAPLASVFRPEAWNHYTVKCIGPRVEVELNGLEILAVDLDRETATALRHDGTEAPALRDRPRRGRIGFQELSRGGGQVRIRNARILVLDES